MTKNSQRGWWLDVQWQRVPENGCCNRKRAPSNGGSSWFEVIQLQVVVTVLHNTEIGKLPNRSLYAWNAISSKHSEMWVRGQPTAAYLYVEWNYIIRFNLILLLLLYCTLIYNLTLKLSLMCMMHILTEQECCYGVFKWSDGNWVPHIVRKEVPVVSAGIKNAHRP